MQKKTKLCIILFISIILIGTWFFYKQEKKKEVVGITSIKLNAYVIKNGKYQLEKKPKDCETSIITIQKKSNSDKKDKGEN